jgi:hypothetical protein
MIQSLGHETLAQAIWITVLLGGGSAWLTGEAIARTWRPFQHFVFAALALGGAVRFFHFALFDAPLVNTVAYLVDTAFLIVIGAIAWRRTRARQMVRQYFWLYKSSGPLSWRLRQQAPGKRGIDA